MLLIYCLETSYLKQLVSLSRSLPLCRIGANSIDVRHAARVSYENKELSAATQFPLNADFAKYKWNAPYGEKEMGSAVEYVCGRERKRATLAILQEKLKNLCFHWNQSHFNLLSEHSNTRKLWFPHCQRLAITGELKIKSHADYWVWERERERKTWLVMTTVLMD